MAPTLQIILTQDSGSSSFCCLGFAHSKGLTCCNPVPQRDRIAATSLSGTIPTLVQDPSLLRPAVRKLAKLCLCKKNHQYQADEVMERWMGIIQSVWGVPGREQQANAPQATAAPPTVMSSTRPLPEMVQPPPVGRATTIQPTAARSTYLAPETVQLPLARQTIAHPSKIVRACRQAPRMLQLAPARQTNEAPPTTTRSTLDTRDTFQASLDRQAEAAPFDPYRVY